MIITEELSEISVNYKSKKRVSDLPKINSSKDAEQHFRRIWSDKLEYIEEMYLLLLNRSNRVLGYMQLSKGGTSGTVVDPKIIFQTALKVNAHGFIIAHNHPSGNLRPSDADLNLTKQLKAAGQFLELPILDHLILTKEEFYSFVDEGMI